MQEQKGVANSWIEGGREVHLYLTNAEKKVWELDFEVKLIKNKTEIYENAEMSNKFKKLLKESLVEDPSKILVKEGNWQLIEQYLAQNGSSCIKLVIVGTKVEKVEDGYHSSISKFKLDFSKFSKNDESEHF